MNDLDPHLSPLAESDLPPQFEYNLFSKEDPRALINLVPTQVQDAFEAARLQRPDLIGLDERGLLLKLKDEGCQPNATDNRLRMKFWMEYDAAQEMGRKLHITYAFSGVCSNEFFYRKYLTNPTRVAWLLCIPTNYNVIAAEALHFGLEQLRDILDTPHLLRDGSPNTKLMEIKSKIVHMLDQRVKGAVVQKLLNVNVSAAGQRQIRGVAQVSSMDELNRRMIELERRARRAQNIIETGSVRVEQTDSDVSE